MPKVAKVRDGTDPGATLGEVFTASLGLQEIVREGAFLDYLMLGMNGAIATAAVVIETFADLLSEFSLRLGADFRIVGDMNDLCALMGAYYKELPVLGENSDGTGNDFIGGMKVPVQAPIPEGMRIYNAATRTAQTNVATEVLGISSHWGDDAAGKKPVHAVVITHTSAAATGYEIVGKILPQIGRLVKLLVAVVGANDLADGNVDTSVQRIRVSSDKEVLSQWNVLTDGRTVAEVNLVAQSIYADLLGRYKVFEVPAPGISLKEQALSLSIDVQDVSDALRIIPVIEME